MAMFEDFDDEDEAPFTEGDDDFQEEEGNKTFIVAASILGGIILLALICVAVYALVVLPKKKATLEEAGNAAVAQATEVVLMLTESGAETALAETPLASPSPIMSATATETPVVAIATDTPTATPNTAATGTVAAALTEASNSIQTIVPVSSALPDGGFADDVGIPGLMMLTLLFVAVIFFARKLRKASA